MKNVSILVLVVLIVGVMALYFVSFQVRQNETAIILTFNKPTKDIVDPGFHFKLPTPIQTIVKYDKRQILFEGVEEETVTKGGEPIIVQTYIVWQIAEPRKFREAVRDVPGAEKLLKSRLRDVQNKIVGKHYFSEFVNTDRKQIKFSEIEGEMLEQLAEPVKTAYGMKINAVGIKMLKVSEKVTEDVFARMKADRNRKTEATKAQGFAEATRIKSDAESKITELMAATEARAKAIRGEGDAEAAQYYKMLEADPEFAMFLREIETLKKTMKDRTTIVLPADAEPFKLLKEMPKIEPKQSGTK
jgi:membrane protease subunit HflC